MTVTSLERDMILLIAILANSVTIVTGIRSLRHKLNGHLREHIDLAKKIDKHVNGETADDTSRG